jgi:hypothetical protein
LVFEASRQHTIEDEGTAHMNPETFRTQIAKLAAQFAGRPLDAALDACLNAEHGVGSATFRGLEASCQTGEAEVRLCDREGGGIRHGRQFKPADDLHGFSLDVVGMTDVIGPHHTPPNGEIDLILPIEGDALFDGRPAGWLVCAPGSAHRPTVTQGRALILYLLPHGAIQLAQ